MEGFDPAKFVEEQIKEIKRVVGAERALVAVSGGVDSSTCAVLTRRAIGENLTCVFIDDAFMREGEPEMVAEALRKEPLNVPVKIVNVQERFMNAMKGLVDAEEKRRRFRETFYQVLSEIARSEGCRFLVQGTIKADVIETVGGVKTQHNVLEQMGINPMEQFGFKVVEPLKMLYKWQVRAVARYLGLPPEISERQPFPGPGLSVRVVGEIRSDKLEALKKTTAIVEKALASYKPSQYFAFIIDNVAYDADSSVTYIRETAARFLNVPSRNVRVTIFRDKATGIRGGRRSYGRVLGLKVETPKGEIYPADIRSLLSLQAKILNECPEFSRMLYMIRESQVDRPYVIGIRAVETKDFLTAEVSNIPWKVLDEIALGILSKRSDVAAVYYDITPKPPGTIEME